MHNNYIIVPILWLKYFLLMWAFLNGAQTCDPLVTTGIVLEFDGAVGAGGVGWVVGLSNLARGVECDAFPSAASSLMQTTLDLGHLCFLAVLWDLNLCPHASHCH